jgi:2-oxoglutarate ferredoxin oxidoreductase subunit beta
MDRCFHPTVVALDQVPEDELLIHDEHSPDAHLAFLLSRMTNPQYPVPFGVFRDIDRPTYEDGVLGQVTRAQDQKGVGRLADLYEAADTWTVQPGSNGHNGHQG